MSKATLALIAAAGAATGAAATAAIFSARTERKASQAASSTSIPATSTTSNSLPVSPSTIGTPLRITAPVDPSGLFQYGFPGPIADLATRHSLVSSFDRRLRNPSWVAEHITPESLAMNNADRKHSTFAEDNAIPEK